ncbi:MAG: hypothetical protein QXO15_08155 [Nitrososphaerota archaeon]
MEDGIYKWDAGTNGTVGRRDASSYIDMAFLRLALPSKADGPFVHILSYPGNPLWDS